MTTKFSNACTFQKWNSLSRHEPRRWLIDRLIPSSGVIGISGHPKTGKTFFALGMSAHIASGLPYRGRKVLKGPVAYIMAEGGESLGDRKEAIRSEMFGGREDDLPVFFMTSPVDIIQGSEEFIQSLRQELGDQVPVAVIVDTLNATLFGSENSDEDMSAYMRKLQSIKTAFNCAVIVIHHLAKKDSSGARGHGAFLGGLDALFNLKVNEAQNLILTVAMMRDGPKGAVLVSRLKEVMIGQDDEGEDITSCVVADVGSAGNKNAGIRPRARDSLACLEELIKRGGMKPPKNLELPKGVCVVTNDAWKKACKLKKIGEPNAGDSASKARGRARNVLIKQKLVIKVGDYVYIPPTSSKLFWEMPEDRTPSP